MNPNLLAFQKRGMAFAQAAMGRSITIVSTGKKVEGVRTELQVDPGDVQPGGYRIKRAFSLRVGDARIVEDLSVGAEVTDDMDRPAKFLRYDVDHLGAQLYFGSVYT